ncbi:MAG: VanZ family protein [Bacillota bacterium]|nr:VanZ family protein [Bacillota bacterium]
MGPVLLIYFGIGSILSIIINIIVYLFSIKKKEVISIGKIISRLIFVGYLIMLILVTLIMNYNPSIVEKSNLIPFVDILNNIKLYGLFNGLNQFGLNVIMFIPMGILLPIIFKKKNWNFKFALFISFAITFAIEIMQFFTGRAADIDDVIANTIGGAVGYLVYNVIYKLILHHKN